jgi:hypothetical protein
LRRNGTETEPLRTRVDVYDRAMNAR